MEFAFSWGHKPQMKTKMAWKGSSNTAVSPGVDGDSRERIEGLHWSAVLQASGRG